MSGEQDVRSEPDLAYERASRAKVFTVAAAVCAALTGWFLFHNVFLSPVTGIAGAFCARRGIRNGGNRTLLLVLMVICLLPALLAIVALLTLLPNLPSLSFSHVRVVGG